MINILRRGKILSFLNNQGTTFTPHSLRVRYEPPDDTMMIDISAIKSLELIQSVDQGAKQASLLGLMNSISTPMGLRLLRTNILQPSTQVERVIEPRLEAVEELVSDVDMFNELRSGMCNTMWENLLNNIQLSNRFLM